MKNLVSFKNLENQIYVDLIFINFSKSFINIKSTKIGLFDFHDLNLIVLRNHDENHKPKIVNYRDIISETRDFL